MAQREQIKRKLPVSTTTPSHQKTSERGTAQHIAQHIVQYSTAQHSVNKVNFGRHPNPNPNPPRRNIMPESRRMRCIRRGDVPSFLLFAESSSARVFLLAGEGSSLEPYELSLTGSWLHTRRPLLMYIPRTKRWLARR